MISETGLTFSCDRFLGFKLYQLCTVGVLEMFGGTTGVWILDLPHAKQVFWPAEFSSAQELNLNSDLMMEKTPSTPSNNSQVTLLLPRS